MKRLAVIGAGSWGTALAVVAHRAGHEVRLWSRNPDVLRSIAERRVNSLYLKSATIPADVQVTSELRFATADCDLVILAAPSHAARHLLTEMSTLLAPDAVLVSAAKGIETDSCNRMSQVAEEVLGPSIRFVCLSGPSFASEVVERQPTTIVAASSDNEAALLVQSSLSFENLRIYTNNDVVGTEVGGSLKNVMAIAAGMVTGLGLGANSLAALITRGLAEMSRLALFEGGQIETLMGLAGLGDLVLTCTGTLSRNRFVGEQLGRGKPIGEITREMNEVAEGIKTAAAVQQLAERFGIEMPITRQVNEVIYNGKSAKEAVVDLMNRPLREESYT